MDQNQKLFTQISDISRNLSTLTNMTKKNANNNNTDAENTDLRTIDDGLDRLYKHVSDIKKYIIKGNDFNVKKIAELKSDIKKKSDTKDDNTEQKAMTSKETAKAIINPVSKIPENNTKKNIISNEITKETTLNKKAKESEQNNIEQKADEKPKVEKILLPTPALNNKEKKENTNKNILSKITSIIEPNNKNILDKVIKNDKLKSNVNDVNDNGKKLLDTKEGAKIKETTNNIFNKVFNTNHILNKKEKESNEKTPILNEGNKELNSKTNPLDTDMKKLEDTRNYSRMENNEPELKKITTDISTPTDTKIVNNIKKLAPISKPEQPKSSTDEAIKKDVPVKNNDIPVNSIKTKEKTKPAEQQKPDVDKNQIKPEDIEDIKSLLSRIALILANPLTVSSLESPFRPDSRRI